jgi:hypothetical protein
MLFGNFWMIMEKVPGWRETPEAPQVHGGRALQFRDQVQGISLRAGEKFRGRGAETRLDCITTHFAQARWTDPGTKIIVQNPLRRKNGE